tara:strand:- start:32 stop:487 length:456 start_codon:yes stop_codon:yes gene_type:complete
MAYAIIHKQVGILRPLQKIAMTESEIDDVCDNVREHYNIVNISDEQANQLLREEKLVQSYDGSTLNIIDWPAEEWMTWTADTLNEHKNMLLRQYQITLGNDYVSDAHRAKVEESITALEAFDLSSMGSFNYGFHKKLEEMGVTNILHQLRT